MENNQNQWYIPLNKYVVQNGFPSDNIKYVVAVDEQTQFDAEKQIFKLALIKGIIGFIISSLIIITVLVFLVLFLKEWYVNIPNTNKYWDLTVSNGYYLYYGVNKNFKISAAILFAGILTPIYLVNYLYSALSISSIFKAINLTYSKTIRENVKNKALLTVSYAFAIIAICFIGSLLLSIWAVINQKLIKMTAINGELKPEQKPIRTKHDKSKTDKDKKVPEKAVGFNKPDQNIDNNPHTFSNPRQHNPCNKPQ